MSHRQQEVYLSKTQTGQHGLFTGGFLVWSLDSDDAEIARQTAERLNFKYVERETS
jgi:hypothetical protein